MGLESVQASESNGLRNAFDTIVAPKDAFERLRVVPTWGWALLIAVGLLIAGDLMQRPAQLHAAVGTTEHMMATNSLFSSMSDAKKQEAIQNAAHPPPAQLVIGLIGVAISLFIAVLLNTVVLLLGNAVGRGNAGFKQLWAGSMNVAIPTFGLSYVVLGAICLALGADHFDTTMDVLKSIPGVAMLAPGTGGILAGFLIGLNVFTLWGFGLNVAMMRIVGGVKGAAAWIFPAIVLLGGALINGAFSSFYG